MPPADALRNVAAYLGVTKRTAWDLLQRGGRHFEKAGLLDRIGGKLKLLTRPR